MQQVKYIHYDCWSNIKLFCDNNDFSIDEFICDKINIKISKFDNKITLDVNYCEQSNIKSIMNDLPENVNNIIINIPQNTNTKDLENIFTNLPISLNKLKFIYKQSLLSDIEITKSNGEFNLLFGIKLPINCNVKINYECMDYDVKYKDSNDELELSMIVPVKINYVHIPLKIKYITKVNYVPLDYYCGYSSNIGQSLPLVALQYHQVTLNINFPT